MYICVCRILHIEAENHPYLCDVEASRAALWNSTAIALVAVLMLVLVLVLVLILLLFLTESLGSVSGDAPINCKSFLTYFMIPLSPSRSLGSVWGLRSRLVSVKVYLPPRTCGGRVRNRKWFYQVISIGEDHGILLYFRLLTNVSKCGATNSEEGDAGSRCCIICKQLQRNKEIKK